MPRTATADAIRADDMTDQKNTLLAIVLSAIVLIGWQYFFGMPQIEKQKQQAQQQQQQPAAAAASRAPRRSRATAPQPADHAGADARRAGQHDARGRARRCRRACRSRRRALAGSIALKGGRIDDLALVKYRETVDPKSPADRAARPVGKPASVLRRVRLVAAGAAPR